MPLPDRSHGGRRHADANQLQLIGDAQIAVSGIAFGHFQDLAFHFRWRLVRHARLAASLRSQAFGPELLEGFLDLVVVAATEAGAPASSADVVELLGQGQHAHTSLDKLFCGAHEVVSFRGSLSRGKPKMYH